MIGFTIVTRENDKLMGHPAVPPYMEPEPFADEIGMTFKGTEMVVGVEIAEFEDEDGGTCYHLVYPDGHIDTQSLSKVYKDGNYTMGITRHGDLEVMIDDDGIHRDW